MSRNPFQHPVLTQLNELVEETLELNYIMRALFELNIKLGNDTLAHAFPLEQGNHINGLLQDVCGANQLSFPLVQDGKLIVLNNQVALTEHSLIFH